jgi:hypothetical protein
MAESCGAMNQGTTGKWLERGEQGRGEVDASQTLLLLTITRKALWGEEPRYTDITVGRF